jgi:hypothetical protein|tara:strand:- start:495 stop:791 length:297 start_codon:yes stop_codon:yes gene_type:complete
MSDSVTKYFERENEDMYDEFMALQWSTNSTINIDSEDGIVQDVKDLYEQRSQVGIKKYNTTLEESAEGLEAFLIHLQQELMDATLYIEKLKQLNNERE